MYFTTTTGTIDYYGVAGDQIVLNNGTKLTLETDSMYDITVPSGKHKLVLAESRSQDYVGLGGEALVEIHNFPTLGSVNTFDTCPGNYSSNLVKVPTTLPSNITHIQYMFAGATSFNQDISMWDTSNVVLMFHTFAGASAFNQDISGWNTNKVTDMYNMFENATAFNSDLSLWDTSNVINMSYMFRNAIAFNSDISNWDVSSVTDMNSMFYNATSFNQNLSQWCVSNIASKPSYFNDGAPLFTFDKHPVWGTCPIRVEDIPSDEMHFTTLAGSVDYVGTQGDLILS